MLTAAQLSEKTKTELIEIAKELEVELLTPAKLKKDEIVALLVQGQIARSGIEVACRRRRGGEGEEGRFLQSRRITSPPGCGAGYENWRLSNAISRRLAFPRLCDNQKAIGATRAHQPDASKGHTVKPSHALGVCRAPAARTSAMFYFGQDDLNKRPGQTV